MSDAKSTIAPNCPLPHTSQRIQLAHGGGGRLMHDLIQHTFIAELGPVSVQSTLDSAVLDLSGGRLAFTTDSYVVDPLEFPGGDIGSLAVYGTVNDLAVVGAVPHALSVGFILEEGLPLPTLRRVLQSMARAAERVGVAIVTGDTKVVDKGRADGIYINTSGIGMVRENALLGPAHIRPGDHVIVSGDLGRHGIAIVSVREGLAFEVPIVSDCGPVVDEVLALIEGDIGVHCLRDLTRGGLAAALSEIADAAAVGIEIDAAEIPVCDDVAGACELLGLDPTHVANEGRFVAFVAEPDAERALALMGPDARRIGTVVEAGDIPVVVRSTIGVKRRLDWPSGLLLPRIC